MTLDINYFKEELLKEKTRLETELGTIAHHGNKKGDTWEAVNTDLDDSIDADANEVADKLEEYETNHAIATDLKIELDNVLSALSKIEADNYGICEVSGHEIEEDRLRANPAARTCKEHMNELEK
jgi:RNA polymerase-binding transcription factor DksA